MRDTLADHTPVGHNVRVDLAVLARTLPEWRPHEAIDTLRLSRRTWTLPSYRLGALAEHRNLARGLLPELQPHRVTYDALVTAHLFLDLANGGVGAADLLGAAECGRGDTHDRRARA